MRHRECWAGRRASRSLKLDHLKGYSGRKNELAKSALAFLDN